MWLLFILLAGPAAAQQPPACTAARAGSVACLGTRLCECRFERGGSVSGVASGHRWDCGILRPNCAAPPADLAPPVGLPEIVVQPNWPPPRR